MKNIKKVCVLTVLLFPALSLARITDGKDHIKLQGQKVVVTLEKGFHFVMASPAGLYIDGEMGSFEPSKKEENKIIFDGAKAKDNSFTVSFYVCDDKKTVCESHEAHLKIQKNKLVKVESTEDKEDMVKPGTL